MAARVLVFTLALVLAGFALVERHDSRTCRASGERLLRGVIDAPGAVRDQLVDEFRADCRGSHQLAVAANGLAGEGLAVHAVELADEAIRREPRNYEGWAALAAALRGRGLDAAAQRAMVQVRRLNPRFGLAPG